MMMKEWEKNVELGEMTHSGLEMNSVQFLAATEKSSLLYE
jgi:hypothetical protein